MTELDWTERKLKQLTKIFDTLKIKGKKGIPIIVEGKNDLSALRELGVIGRIICVKNSAKFLVDLLDDLESGEVTVFVDFDSSGIHLAKKITQYLEEKGVKTDSVLWRKARSLLGKEIKDVEGVPSYLEKLKKRVSHS